MLFGVRRRRLNAIFFGVRNRPLSNQAVEQVRNAADEAAVVLRAGEDLRDRVVDRAAVGERRVRHAGVDAADDDAGGAVRRWTRVAIVSEAVEVLVREPADVI